ncbi:hypothetical protein BDV41DRAFT_546363 [Aspergillus transmontanensis]|uniref:Uncharacterized protein n=1 Tax=Aspergillus transmontanensis TaxID=1034304 RepID=A0A5N6VS01_9EURO|nr:hypothetical protein BDV41DRAFT_546363 [Aspergillus transmontanensis]
MIWLIGWTAIPLSSYYDSLALVTWAIGLTKEKLSFIFHEGKDLDDGVVQNDG